METMYKAMGIILIVIAVILSIAGQSQAAYVIVPLTYINMVCAEIAGLREDLKSNG